MIGRRRKLVLNYDRDHDVLYVSLGAPKPSYADEEIDGILVRRTFDGDRLSGVTIMDFSMRSKKELQERIPFKLNVDELYDFVGKR